MSGRGPVAVTGATGFIGGALARLLIRDGYHVRALVRPASANKPLPDGVERSIGQLDDGDSLARFLEGAQALVHCAGAVRGASPAGFMRTNADAMQPLIGSVNDQASLQSVVLLSSLAAREPAVSPYSASKFAGERAFEQTIGEKRWFILRPPAVYGPGDRELLPLFQAMARGIAPDWGVPEARFSLIFIDDLVRAIAQFLQHSSAPSGVYELHDGSHNGYSMADVRHIASSVLGRRIYRIPVPRALLNMMASANLRCARFLGYEPMLTPWKLSELRHPRWVCDNSAITDATGWTPQVALAKGLPLALATTAIQHAP